MDDNWQPYGYLLKYNEFDFMQAMVKYEST